MFCFEIYGYDFIIDKDYEPWLLEINDNPGLCESSPLIGILIPRMLDDAFRITIYKIFNTKYDDKRFEKGKYKSPFPIKGLSSFENLWEFV